MSSTKLTKIKDIVSRFDFLNINSHYKIDNKLIRSYENYLQYRKLNENDEVFPIGIPTFINVTSDCTNCFYGFQIDSYMFGCSHECTYCWAKSELTKISQWNSPAPVPIDLTSLWMALFQTFEKENNNSPEHPLSSILKRKIPIRIGSMSDPFLSLEKKYLITFELLKLLNFYNYPYVLLTRSHLVSEDLYLDLIKPENATIQISIPSINESFIRLIEPGSPTAIERLAAIKKLRAKNIWVTARLNPLFPNFPDGHFSLNNGDYNSKPSYDFFTLQTLEKLKENDCLSVLVGFVHLDQSTMETVSKKLSIDLSSYMTTESRNLNRGFTYSRPEIRMYYEKIHDRCKELKLGFSTCYLGLGDQYFWKDKELWANKDDCCNLKGNVANFKETALDIKMSEQISNSNVNQSPLKNFFLLSILKTKSFMMKKIFYQ